MYYYVFCNYVLFIFAPTSNYVLFFFLLQVIEQRWQATVIGPWTQFTKDHASCRRRRRGRRRDRTRGGGGGPPDVGGAVSSHAAWGGAGGGGGARGRVGRWAGLADGRGGAARGRRVGGGRHGFRFLWLLFECLLARSRKPPTGSASSPTPSDSPRRAKVSNFICYHHYFIWYDEKN